ncbi:MAG TPA: NAD(P)H-binding protein [Candidatus Acidoferrum sp.]
MDSNDVSSRVAVLAGASGLVGSECLRLLLDSANYHLVMALVRRPLQVAHPKLRQLKVDFARLPRLSEFAGADVFSALGTTMSQAGSREAFRKVDFDATLSFATIAAQCRARQFVMVSSIGADAHSPTFYLKVKGELEDALKSLSFSSLHIFRPSFLAGDHLGNSPGERVSAAVTQALDFSLVGKLKKFSAIDAADLAAAMLNAALRAVPGAHVYEYEQILELAKS